MTLLACSPSSDALFVASSVSVPRFSRGRDSVTLFFKSSKFIFSSLFWGLRVHSKGRRDKVQTIRSIICEKTMV
ncbi:hypothetical protein F2382_02226 [Listeria monocytogenes]|nr:hypothetical protein F2382_02226 [Listeria monocytogenes]